MRVTGGCLCPDLTSSHHWTWDVCILIFVCLFHLFKYFANFIANEQFDYVGELTELSVMKNT